MYGHFTLPDAHSFHQDDIEAGRLAKRDAFTGFPGDTPKGIPGRDGNKVFEPGFTTKKRGWGMGLALVQRIVSQYHGGRINIEATSSHGTTFQIILPPADLAGAEVELVGPPDHLPTWELVNLEGEPTSADLADGRRRLSWTWRHLDGLRIDVPPAPPFTTGRLFLYSSHPDWGELASWYQRHVAPRVRVSRQIEELAERLTETLDGLAEEAISRDPARFRTLVLGRTGVGGTYDITRRLKAWVSGRKFDSAHGDDRK